MRWWLSSERMTIEVEVDKHWVVVAAPPIARKFIGQHLRNLSTWMRKQGGFRSKRLEQ